MMMMTMMKKEVEFVNWEELVISNEKGRREVHYYLKKKDGSKDLAVVGKERTLRHMSYTYVLPSLSPSPPPLPHKLKSRKEVLDWLSTIVSDSFSSGLLQPIASSVAKSTTLVADTAALKDLHMKKPGQRSKDFLWLGSAWTCRKKRRHYQSFCRNGIIISVNDFIYVLAEENKRLVAYMEDLYEDSRGNKMVGVRWFHKIDEVGIVLPPNFNDREIFFSLCLQDLSVECIDGLATVLSLQHFEKFRKEAAITLWEPFMCHRQFDNDEISAFDVTQVQGYWKQEILRYMKISCPSRHLVPEIAGGYVEGEDDVDDVLKSRPRKKQRGAINRDLEHQFVDKKENRLSASVDMQKGSNCLLVSSIPGGPREPTSAVCLSEKKLDLETPSTHVGVGCDVEVLSQDSGIRGCWFRAVVVKMHKNKVKVQYHDIKDAVDEANNLQEWVLASRIATADKLGLRLCGRTTVRPYPASNKGKVQLGFFDVGTPVDAWWHDGWWEGIVVRKDLEDRVQVYFPGEGRMSIFGCDDLRCSQDWVSNKWNRIKKRPDLVGSILAGLKTRPVDVKTCETGMLVMTCENRQQVGNNGSNVEKASCTKNALCLEPAQVDGGKTGDVIPNLAKDNLLTELKWNPSRKRRRSRDRLRKGGNSGLNQFSDGSSSSGREDLNSSPASENFVLPSSLILDSEICKYRGDSVLNASMSSLTSLVMSR